MPDETPSQPDPSPPASEDPTATAVAVMDPPADPGEAGPALEGEQPAAEGAEDGGSAGGPVLSRETLAAVAELAEDDLVEILRPRIEREAQSLADQRTQEARGDFTLDREWNELTERYQSTAQAYNAEAEAAALALQQFAQGHDVDPADIAAKTRTALARSGELAQLATARATREQFKVVDDIFAEMVGDADSPNAKLVVSKADDGTPITVNDAYAGAIEGYYRLLNAGSKAIEQAQRTGQPLPPETVQQIVRARQSALPTLVRQAMQIAMAVAGHTESTRALSAAEKKKAAERRVIEDNKLKELAAAGRLNGQTPPATGGAQQSGDPAKLNDRVAYGIDSDGNRVTEADRAAFRARYPG